MKKILILFMILGIVNFANAQKKRKIKVENATYVVKIDNFNLIFQDTQGQMDVHETMAKIDPTHNPDLNIIKDEKEGIWRLAISLEESNLMPDKMKVVSVKYDDILPYKRTGYN